MLSSARLAHIIPNGYLRVRWTIPSNVGPPSTRRPALSGEARRGLGEKASLLQDVGLSLGSAISTGM
jgi:hypothetical protein